MANLTSYEESQLTESLNQFWANFNRKFAHGPLPPCAADSNASKWDSFWQDSADSEIPDLNVDLCEKEELGRPSASCDAPSCEDSESSSRSSDDEFEPHANYQDEFCVRSGTVCVVDGALTGDIPCVYTIKGILPHELPVIGTFVHPRIVPGFSYCVRPVNSSHLYFEGEALCLQKIGLGYGKRLTFDGKSLNENDNYFWSDTNAEGYGFSLQLVHVNDKFTVQDANKDPIAILTVNSLVVPQIETEHKVLPKNRIEKCAKVFLHCQIHFFEETKPSHETALVTGTAVAVKDPKSRSPAAVKRVKDCIINGTKGYTLVPGGQQVIRSQTVCGSSVKDIPASYTIKGLLDHELPVIGSFVDSRVTPGFKYKVRPIGSKKCFFEGKALTLVSIGRGYGKRLTFSGQSLNFNDNYFWSDTNPEGYGFALEAVSEGDTFSIEDNSGAVVGKAVVYMADAPQVEIESFTENPKNVYTKKVRVSIVCHLSLFGESECTTHVTGVAYSERRGRTASVTRIEDIAIGSHINILLSSGGESLKFIRD